jgi:hypothetical protein
MLVKVRAVLLGACKERQYFGKEITWNETVWKA